MAQSLLLAGDHEAALNAYRQLEKEEQKPDERIAIQYMIACCLRKLGKLDEATLLYREVANSGGNDILVENAQWYLRDQGPARAGRTVRRAAAAPANDGAEETMMNADAEMQAVLHAALEREAACYEAALQPVAELAAACRRGEPIDGPLAAGLDSPPRHRPNKTPASPGSNGSGRKSGRPASPALRAVAERVAALIRQLSAEMRIIEEAVRARRDQLAAELDGCNRRCQMQRAYLRKS